MDKLQWSDLLINLSFSLAGGLVKCITSKVKRKKLSHFVASAAIGGFAGLLTYMLCSNFGATWQLTSFATGVAGYMGDSILNVFTDFLPKIFTSKFNIQISTSNELKEKCEDESKDDENKENK